MLLNKNQIQEKTGMKSAYYFEKMLKTANTITLNRAFLIQKKLLDFDLRSKSTSFNQPLEFELLLLLHDAPFQPVPDRSRIVVQLFRGEPAQL